MRRLNSSHVSMSDSLCDVSLSGNVAPASPRFGTHVLRKNGLMTSLPSVSDCRRPSNYFLAKNSDLTHSSNSRGLVRPKSSISLSSFDAYKDSDDGALVVLTPFDVVESRFSSATATSVYSGKNIDSDTKSSNALDHDSVSRPTISSTTTLSAQPLSDLAEVPSTANLSFSDINNSSRTVSLSHLEKSRMLYTLGRTKTRYYNPNETKERRQLRKKLYEENSDDDVILSQDVKLVFNVPVIEKHPLIYSHGLGPKSSSYFSRNDIIRVDDNKYHSFRLLMRPCPLPGALSQNRAKSTRGVSNSSQQIYPYESFTDLHPSSFPFMDTDEEVSRNISDFYALRSESYSKLVRASRENHIYNLPNYVRSQSSIEDVILVSPEKLEVIDQSRPINLPPKSTEDIFKHRKEINKVFKSVETSSKSQSLSRQRMDENLASARLMWSKLSSTADDKELSVALNSNKEKLRTFIWESHINDSLTFSFFSRVLRLNLSDAAVAHLHAEYDRTEYAHRLLSEQMKATKNAEFDKIISHVIARPLINNLLREVKECMQAEFSLSDFVESYRHLLFLKSLSGGGLKKHHQLFVIPIFLILFRSEALAEIYPLIEMFDAEIFLDEVFTDLAERLSSWSTLSGLSYSSAAYKVLSRFSSLDEFESLNSSTIFELFLQLNDRLPLSLSATSTPILSRLSFSSYPEIIEDNDYASLEGVSSNSGSSASLMSSALTYSAPISTSYKLLMTFLQLLVIYSRSRRRNQNYLRLMQSFLLTIFDYYHIGWNTPEELIKNNSSIRLNHTNNHCKNLESFMTKWKTLFRKL